ARASSRVVATRRVTVPRVHHSEHSSQNGHSIAAIAPIDGMRRMIAASIDQRIHSTTPVGVLPLRFHAAFSFTCTTRRSRRPALLRLAAKRTFRPSARVRNAKRQTPHAV